MRLDEAVRHLAAVRAEAESELDREGVPYDTERYYLVELIDAARGVEGAWDG